MGIGTRAIWGSGVGDVYAVGFSGEILHSTGNGTWTRQDSGTTAQLTGIWGSSANDVYICANSNLILHSTGDGNWAHLVFPAGRTFEDIWGSGPDDIYAVRGGAAHFTNGMWIEPPEKVALMAEPIVGVWGSSSTDVYAAGSRSWMYHSKGDGIWQSQKTSAVNLLDTSGSSSDDIYAVSYDAVFHSTGNGSWTQQTLLPVDGGVSEALLSVWVLNSVAVYVTTNRDRVLRSGGDGQWLSQEVDPVNYIGGIYGIWGTSPTNLYLAARNGIYKGTKP